MSQHPGLSQVLDHSFLALVDVAQQLDLALEQVVLVSERADVLFVFLDLVERHIKDLLMPLLIDQLLLLWLLFFLSYRGIRILELIELALEIVRC